MLISKIGIRPGFMGLMDRTFLLYKSSLVSHDLLIHCAPARDARRGCEKARTERAFEPRAKRRSGARNGAPEFTHSAMFSA